MCKNLWSLLFSLGLIFAVEINDVANSAPDGNVILFNFDLVENDRSLVDSSLYVSDDSQASWSRYDLYFDGSLGYENTYYQEIEIVTDFFYYCRFETDSILLTESPEYLGSVEWPSNNYYADGQVDIEDDDMGITIEDSIFNYANTDLRQLKLSYSDSMVYIKLLTSGDIEIQRNPLIRHCSNPFLTWDQYVNFYYFYEIEIINPELAVDSVRYVILYADVEIYLSGIAISLDPGIYRVREVSGSSILDYFFGYEKINNSTNFNYACLEDSISFSFEKSLLTSESEFGELASSQDIFLSTRIFTIASWAKGCESIGNDTIFTYVNDNLKDVVYYMRTHYQDAGNEIPELNTPSCVYVSSGFELEVNYYDTDNNCPTMRYLEIGGCYPTFHQMWSADHQYGDSSTFTVLIDSVYSYSFPYRFIFCDGSDTVRTAWDTVFTGIATIDISTYSSVAWLDTFDIGGHSFIREEDTVIIVNEGTIPIDFGIELVSITDSIGRFFATDDTIGINQFNTKVIFSDYSPGIFEYGDLENISSFGEILWADENLFAGGGYSVMPECYNGSVVDYLSRSEKIYMKLSAPTYISDAYSAEMKIVVILIIHSRATMP